MDAAKPSAPAAVRAGESAAEKRARHAQKRAKVAAHRSEILRRQEAAAGRERARARASHGGLLSPAPAAAGGGGAGALMLTLGGGVGLLGAAAEGKQAALALDDDLLHAHDALQGVPAAARAGAVHGAAAAARAGAGGATAGAGCGAAGAVAPMVTHDAAEAARAPPPRRADAALADDAQARAAGAAAAAGASGGAAAGAADEPVVDWMSRGTHMHLDLYDAVYKHADPATIVGLRARGKAAAGGAAKPPPPPPGGAAAAAAAGGGGGALAARIDASFRAVDGSVAVEHPTNRALKARRSWALLPAVASWALAKSCVLVEFDADPDASAAASSPAAASAGGAPAAKRARLEAGVLRTAGAGGGPHVDYLLPVSAPAPAPAPGGTLLRGVRRYHIAVDALGGEAGEEQVLLLWDDAASTVSFLPLRTRAQLTRVPTDDAASAIADVLRTEREPTAEEADAAIEAEAGVTGGARAVELRAIVAARRARRTAAAAEAAAAAAAAAVAEA
jgi:hypothetical protein